MNLAITPEQPPVNSDFIAALKSFAANGYQFGETYSLYKASQQEAFQGFLEGLREGYKHGYIELPTGVGKTALFIALVKNYLSTGNIVAGSSRVLILVPTEKLVVQTAEAFAKFLPEIARTIETDGDNGQEIDWEHSKLGVQYRRMKHADRTPEVLITTYQSLARDRSGKVYPSSDYGFIIYDEGHVTTAPIYGLAIKKFSCAIQLAITATPEYSETKRVSKQLPYLYFRLPLSEAINRGDLCSVRPAIIKTGYTIDRALFESMMKTRNGTPLSERQLQQLLNQEARNKAVIETYLRGGDPDSGERYFGQNGMIFCTGTKHADDISEQFRKALYGEKNIKLANWLDQQEIELIAPVHGKSEGCWLRAGMLPNKPEQNRRISGPLEWYTEEEIFALHEQGKILLLASVAKLKWGYDCPPDTLLFDLADRFSLLDATQIYGRAFRLNPEDPSKIATVFNLMDKNTEEIYAEYPHWTPIYCHEVIKGAEFRPPTRRPHAMGRFTEPPPDMERSLAECGFELITDIKQVEEISIRNRERRESASPRYPEKTAEWLGVVDMARASQRAPAAISPTYKVLRIAWERARRAGQDQISGGGLTLPITLAGIFQGKVFCLHRSLAPRFSSPLKTSEWLGISDMAREAKRSDRHISSIYVELKAAWLNAIQEGQNTFCADGMSIPVEGAGMFRAGNNVDFCVHRQSVHLFCQPEKTPEWLGINQMARILKKSPSAVSKVFEELKTAWSIANNNAKDSFTVGDIEILTSQAGYFRARSREFFCLHRSELDTLRKLIA